MSLCASVRHFLDGARLTILMQQLLNAAFCWLSDEMILQLILALKAQTPTDSVASFPKIRVLKLAEGGVLTWALPHGRLISETVATYHENIAVRSFTGFQISYTFCCCMDKKRYRLAPSISSAVVRNDRSKEAVPTPQQFWKYWSSHPASFRDWGLLMFQLNHLYQGTLVWREYTWVKTLSQELHLASSSCSISYISYIM